MEVSPHGTRTRPFPPGARDVPLVGLCAFLALLPAWVNYDIISRDGAFQYIPMAQAFLQGSFRETLLDNPQLPLYPLIMAGISKATGLSLELSGRSAAFLGYVLAAMGMYAVSFLIFRDRLISFLAALIFMGNPRLMNSSVDCLKESLLLCAIIAGNGMAVKGMSAGRGRWPLYLGSAACFAAGALLRSAALVFPCAWLILWAFRGKRGRCRRAALLAAPIVGFVAAWVLFPELPLFRKSCYQPGYFFSTLHGAPDLFRSLKNVFLEFFSVGSPGVMLFAIYGAHRSERGSYVLHVLLSSGIFFLVLVFWVHSASRYFLAPVTWAYPLAAFGLMAAFRSGGRWAKVVGVLALISCLALWAHCAFTPPDPERVAWREAGVWIGSELGPGREIISNRDRLVFYAQGKRLPLSAFTPEDPHARVLAIDTSLKDGAALCAALRSLGKSPVKRFGRIAVYLPGALRY